MRPIDPAYVAAAVAVLSIGFPKATALFWQSALDRLRAFGGNAEAGVPIGHLLMADDKAVGVILTPARMRTRPDGTRQKIVNLSSWYIDPAHRWRAPVMLRAVTGSALHVVWLRHLTRDELMLRWFELSVALLATVLLLSDSGSLQSSFRNVCLRRNHSNARAAEPRHCTTIARQRLGATVRPNSSANLAISIGFNRVHHRSESLISGTARRAVALAVLVLFNN